MIVRNLESLKMNKKLAKVESNVYEDKNVGLVFVLNHGFVLFVSCAGKWNDVFIIKTATKPLDYVEEGNDKKILENKNDFIELIHGLLDKIYEDTGIKEYEKKHPEYIFLELIDKLTSGGVELIDESFEYYDDIDEGFLRLEVEQMTNFAKSTSFRLRALFSPQKPRNQAASDSLDEKLRKHDMM